TGTLISATLVTPIELGTMGSQTVIARAESVLPKGARLIGSASFSDGRIALRFQRIILGTGREARIQAEAQDSDGAFGIPAAIQGQPEEEPSAAREAAKDTATDALLETLGMGAAGRGARNYMRRSSERDPAGSKPKVTLPAGTKFTVFVH